MRLKKILACMLFVAALLAEGVAAQATDTPTFFAPTRGFGDTEVGASVSGGGGGGGVAVEGRYGFSLNRSEMGL